MNIALRGGHTEKATGSSLLINELKADRLVYKSVMKYLKQGGANVIDVTPPENTPYPQELNYGIAKANKLGVDLFVSIHFNNAYNKEVKSGMGSEVWVYNKPFGEATRTVNNLASLGFKNRGVKSMVSEGRSLGELKNTKMKAMIVEVCFVESREDFNIFKNKGYDLIGKKIAEGILNKTISSSQENSSGSSSGFYRVVVASYKDKNNANKMKDELIKKGYKDTFLVYEKGV